jgi:hypothetical protein
VYTGVGVIRGFVREMLLNQQFFTTFFSQLPVAASVACSMGFGLQNSTLVLGKP